MSYTDTKWKKFIVKDSQMLGYDYSSYFFLFPVVCRSILKFYLAFIPFSYRNQDIYVFLIRAQLKKHVLILYFNVTNL